MLEARLVLGMQIMVRIADDGIQGFTVRFRPKDC